MNIWEKSAGMWNDEKKERREGVICGLTVGRSR